MDKYNILARYGAGSYAVVWKAKRKSDGKLVAIKQLKESVHSWDQVKELAEVKYLSKLRNHDNVIRLEEVVRMGDQVGGVQGPVRIGLWNYPLTRWRLVLVLVLWCWRCYRIPSGLPCLHVL